MNHLDEMTCLLYLERQLDRARAQDVSAHTQDCAACRTLLRALERESRLLTRAMLEEEEPLPARLAPDSSRRPVALAGLWIAALCPFTANYTAVTVSYTHLTLPTICSV